MDENKIRELEYHYKELEKKVFNDSRRLEEKIDKLNKENSTLSILLIVLTVYVILIEIGVL